MTEKISRTADCERLVGASTRDVLKNECVTAIAYVIDKRLHYMVDHKNYGRGRK